MAGFGFDDAVFGHLAGQFGVADQRKAELIALADSMHSSLFKQQQDLIKDPAKKKAALCPRRGGKSHVAADYAFETCLRKPRALVGIINLTLKVGRRNFWDIIFPPLISQFGVPCKPYQNELRLKFINDSQLYLLGADKRDAIEDLRGSQFDLIIIDECKSYPPDLLKELVQEVLQPLLRDRNGTLLMIGTPGSNFKGPFFEATYPGAEFEVGTGKNTKKRLYSRSFAEPEKFWAEHPTLRPQWSRHSWTVLDNVSMLEADGSNRLWKAALQEKDDNGWADDEPIWQRESLGQWVVGSDAFVYAYANLASTNPDLVHWTPDYTNPANNEWGLPKSDEWRYLLGVDLGYEDAFALVVGAYNKHDGKLYQVWEDQETHLDVIDCANRICKAIERFGRFDAIVIDSGALGKQITETFRRRYPIPAKDAEKPRKFEFIEFMNADYRAGRIKILPKSGLALQSVTLQLDLSKGKKQELARMERLRENRTQANHLCDAWLYLWRYSYHYYRKDRIVLEQPGTPEYDLAMMRAEQKAFTAKQREQASDAAGGNWLNSRLNEQYGPGWRHGSN